MKTLDEVICKFEICNNSDGDCYSCPYSGENCACDKDAITYLKEYQIKKSRLDAEIERYQEAVRNCEMAENKYQWLLQKTQQPLLDNNLTELDNPPLTWDELKRMEDKPVWVEWLHYDMWADKAHHTVRDWWIVGEVRKDDIIIAQYLDEAELLPSDLGIVWQAYRKERDENAG